MPTEINGYSPSEETALSSLIINEVDSNETFEKMKEKGILQDNQLYLVTDEQEGGTYYTAGEVDELLQNKANTSSVYTKTETDTLLQKKINPNLLDNWYFGNPINQRGGKIILAGITYYSDTSLSTAAGTTNEPFAATVVNSTYGSISVSGTTYYVAASDIVDGYILKPGTISYTFDRWKLSFHGSYIYVKNGCLQFYATAGNNELLQEIDNKLSGETIILSAIVNDVLYCTDPAIVPTSITGGNRVIATRAIPNVGYIRIYQLASGNIACAIDTTTVTSFTVKAMKLELGDHQTLAHQDANGNWVLNEIPDYGEQLAKCQRYYYQITTESNTKYAYFASGNYYSLGVGILLVPLKVRMRITPVLSFSSLNDFLVMSNGGYTLTKLELSDLGTDVVRLLVETNGGPAGQGATMRFGGSVGAYIGFSADL